MHDKLKMILEDKVKEVERTKQDADLLENLLSGKTQQAVTGSLATALQSPSLTVISEIKRRSPSKGELAEISNPIELAKIYQEAGAGAISILTDAHFSGSIKDLKQVSQTIRNTPLLRKDFVIDPIQIAEAVMAGASAVLLIVAVLEERTEDFIKICEKLGIDALVEIHNERELEIALNAGAKIIGINNRNLHDFEVDTDRAFELKKMIPEGILTVAESGITTPELARDYAQAGFDGVLIGEALVKSGDPGKFIEACVHC